jgi:hypothetical protein
MLCCQSRNGGLDQSEESGVASPHNRNGRQRPILGIASTTERTVARAGFELAQRASSTGIGNRLGGSKAVVAAIQAAWEPAS